MKKKSIVWIILFLVIIVSPRVTYFFLSAYVDSENYEKRIRKTKPSFMLNTYSDFSKEYEAYFNDHIPFRNQLIYANSWINYYIFHQSSSDKVALGKDGWLFYCNEKDGNPVEQSLGYWKFTDIQLENITKDLLATQRILNSLGVEFVFFIAPNKESIYMDKLPQYYEKQDEYTSTDQLVKYLRENTDIRVVYPKDILINTRKQYPDIELYYELDTHWNSAGGYLGAASLAEELGIMMPDMSELLLEPYVSVERDLEKMLNLRLESKNIDYNIDKISDLNTEVLEWDFDNTFLFHTPSADRRRLFVRRDSFSTHMAPNLATQFESSMWVHAKNFREQDFFDFDADIFVLEQSERYVGRECRISLVNISVEKLEDGSRNIIIRPAIKELNLQYSSIYKKAETSNTEDTIQYAKTLNQPVIVNVPEKESGEIWIEVYTDESLTLLWDELKMTY